ncbi:MAG: acetate--CoA ligase family protein [Chloroflexota bacterium]
MSTHSLDRLFNPASIAVVGASANETKAGYQMLKALQHFSGSLYPINPKIDEILGYKTYPNLSAVKQSIDLVILTIPAQFCPDVLTEAGQLRIGAAMIIGGGFAETGEAGQALQAEIMSVCRQYGLRLLGPNTSGFANPALALAANFAPGVEALQSGSVAIISQSGAINLTLSFMAQAQGLGIRLSVGLGNAADVGAPDIIDFLADDDETEVIALYLEGIADGRRLVETIRHAVSRKPVVVFTVGQADISDFAASHTGKLMGSFPLKLAALRQAGAVVVDSTEALIDAAQVLSQTRLAPMSNPGVGLLTGQAGPGMIISDYLQSRDIAMPTLSPNTVDQIAEMLPPLTYLKNPVDTGRPSPTFGKILTTIAADPKIDVLLTFTLHEPAAIVPAEVFGQVQGQFDQPLLFGTAGLLESITPTLEALAQISIPAFPSPNRAAQAMWALVEDAKAQYRLSCNRTPEINLPDFDLASVLDEAQAKALLDDLDITTPKRMVCKTQAEAEAAFTSLPKPLVIKVLDATIQHKTEVGGVILGIETEDALSEALNQLKAIPGGADKRYLLEVMADKGLELIIGASNDTSFGPVVLLGQGGTAAEAMGDVTMRLAPLSLTDALTMIDELSIAPLFGGWRGAPPLDRQAVAEAVVKIGSLMLSQANIKEIDLNPVRVYEQGILALDALIVAG